MIEIVGYPRLHVALFDLGTATPRQYGGLGLTINGPHTSVVAKAADRDSLNGFDLVDSRAARDIEEALQRLRSSFPYSPVELTLKCVPQQHIGLGTKTCLVLSALTAVSTHAGLDISRAQLQLLSGRGGTSGIGIHTFFDGGFIMDGGHRVEPPRTYAPSSSKLAGTGIPPIVAHLSLPDSWSVTLMLPAGIRSEGGVEEAFFNAATPIPDREVFEVISLGVMGLGAAIAASDFGSFIGSLNALQKLGFKAREIAPQPASVKALLDELLCIPNCGAGMSSMGPLLFAITRDPLTRSSVEQVALQRGAIHLGTFGFQNSGFLLR